MTFIDWFAGIGGFRKGMELAGHKCIGFCEFDKYAVASYTSMHLITEEQREYLSTLSVKQRQKEILKEQYRNGEWYRSDIRGVEADDIPEADCWCFGFPCQDVSVAGKQKGIHAGTRSGLFFEIIRLLNETPEERRPEWLFIENVKNLLSIDNGWGFFTVLSEMEQVGYNAEWQVLNSKDFGVPQNRERVFIIGHLRGKPGHKVLPLERTDGTNSVEQIGRKPTRNYDNPQSNRVYDSKGLSPTLQSMRGGGLEPMIIKKIGDLKDYPFEAKGRIYSKEGIAPTITSSSMSHPDKVGIKVLGKMARSNGTFRHSDDDVSDEKGIVGTLLAHTEKIQPKIGIRVEVKEANKEGFTTARVGEDSVNYSFPDSETRRARVGEGVANTLTTAIQQGIFITLPNGDSAYALYYPKEDCYIAVRKLTPKECFRLQGWSDDYFEKAEFVNSNSQLYKQAGNGVTVNVIKAIAERF